MFENQRNTSSALGAALQVAEKILVNTVYSFHSQAGE